MDRRAFININGATYEYAYRIAGGRHDSQLQQLERQVERLVIENGGTLHILNVTIDGNPADLNLTPRDVWAATVYLEAEKPTPPAPRMGTRDTTEPNIATVGF